MSKSHLAQVLNSEGEVLFECSPEEKDRAYQYCRELEEMGVEVVLKVPSLPETLAYSLGMSETERDKLKESILQEIRQH